MPEVDLRADAAALRERAEYYEMEARGAAPRLAQEHLALAARLRAKAAQLDAEASGAADGDPHRPVEPSR